MNKMQTVATSLLMLVIGMGLGGAALWGWQIMQPGAGPVASQPAAGPINPESAKVERRILYYRNPMGQPDTSPTPKKDEMGMDYIPVYADEAQDEPGLVALSPARIQSLGVATEVVRREALQRTLRAVGQLAVDERRRVVVAPKFGGWIERLPVNTTGQAVRQGEPLLEVYSPELVAAQQEYLLARDADQTLRLEPAPAGRQRLSLSEGAAQRLRFWDIPAAEIRGLQRSGQVQRALPINAPVSAVVLTNNAVLGKRFEAGETLFELADLQRLWLMVDIFEQDMAQLQPGLPVAVRVNARPGEEFVGKVAFIYPTLNRETRTVPVRIELENPDGRLRPAMYGEARLQLPVAHDALTVPESALIDSGTRQVVLVQQGEGRFLPRSVKVGAHGEDGAGERRVAILSGLVAGERVVTQANFLIDSESSLKATFAGLSAGISAGMSTGVSAGSAAQATPPVTNHDQHGGH